MGLGGPLPLAIGLGFLEGLFLFDLHSTYTRSCLFPLFPFSFCPFANNFKRNPIAKGKDTRFGQINPMNPYIRSLLDA